MMQDEEGRTRPKADELPASDRVYFDGQLSFTEPISASIKAHTFLTPITLSSAKLIATYDGTPVAAAKKVGKGEVYYIGTNLGASIEEGSQAGIDLVRAIVERSVRRSASADAVRPRLIESSQGSLLIVFNDQKSDQTAAIRVPDRYKQATDIYAQQSYTIQSGVLHVKLSYDSVTALRLT